MTKRIFKTARPFAIELISDWEDEFCAFFYGAYNYFIRVRDIYVKNDAAPLQRRGRAVVIGVLAGNHNPAFSDVKLGMCDGTALRIAQTQDFYGIEDFRHLVAHATGTRTNSRTDLAAAHAARLAAAELQGFKARLPRAMGNC